MKHHFRTAIDFLHNAGLCVVAFALLAVGAIHAAGYVMHEYEKVFGSPKLGLDKQR